MSANPVTLTRPIVVSVSEAARLAGLSRSRLYIALKTGELASIKLGKRRLIRFAALEAWLDSHRVD